jgi:branched-subunit amino acid aminotransferase/4-amino-4-deoxychorismate lyase
MSALPSVVARRTARAHGGDEALLIDRDGLVREGAWSSFFWIEKSGIVKTTFDRVLEGITARKVIDSCGACEITSPLHESELLTAIEECFVSQSTHGIIPVSRIISGTLIREFPTTKGMEVMRRFNQYRKANLEHVMEW